MNTRLGDDTETVLSDPLSEVTRRERRSLLGLSAIGLAMAWTRFLPSEISAMSFKFDAQNKAKLMLLIAGVIIYYLIAFILYFRSDRLRWKIELKRAEENADRQADDLTQGSSDEYDHAEKKRRLDLHTGLYKIGKVRGFFEFYFPIVIAVVTIMWLAVTARQINDLDPMPKINLPGCYQLQTIKGKVYKVNTCTGIVEEYILQHAPGVGH